MLIGMKMKKICREIRSQCPFENLHQPGLLNLFLQNGYVYLAEILYGVFVGP